MLVEVKQVYELKFHRMSLMLARREGREIWERTERFELQQVALDALCADTGNFALYRERQAEIRVAHTMLAKPYA